MPRGFIFDNLTCLYMREKWLSGRRHWFAKSTLGSTPGMGSNPIFSVEGPLLERGGGPIPTPQTPPHKPTPPPVRGPNLFFPRAPPPSPRGGGALSPPCSPLPSTIARAPYVAMDGGKECGATFLAPLRPFSSLLFFYHPLISRWWAQVHTLGDCPEGVA